MNDRKIKIVNTILIIMNIITFIITILSYIGIGPFKVIDLENLPQDAIPYGTEKTLVFDDEFWYVNTFGNINFALLQFIQKVDSVKRANLSPKQISDNGIEYSDQRYKADLEKMKKTVNILFVRIQNRSKQYKTIGSTIFAVKEIKKHKDMNLLLLRITKLDFDIYSIYSYNDIRSINNLTVDVIHNLFDSKMDAMNTDEPEKMEYIYGSGIRGEGGSYIRKNDLRKREYNSTNPWNY